MTFPKMTTSRRGSEDFKKHPSREGNELKPCAETFVKLVSDISPSQSISGGFPDSKFYKEIVRRSK